MEQRTPRTIIRDLYNAGMNQEAIREQLSAQTLDQAELVPDQMTPEPLVIADIPDSQEYVGSRSQEEVLDLLYGGIALSLCVAGREYCINWNGSAFCFEVWEEDIRTWFQSYEDYTFLLQTEGSRPSFVLSAFVLVG